MPRISNKFENVHHIKIQNLIFICQLMHDTFLAVSVVYFSETAHFCIHNLI